MGGPWRAKGFDAASWRPPEPAGRAADPGERTAAGERAIVAAYVASVIAAAALGVAVLRAGLW
jgi:hypothetical protein